MYDVVGGLFGRFRVARHVVSNVVFHQLAHEAIYGASRCGQALQHFRALFIFVKTAEDTFELADDFLSAGDKVEFLA
jgi:hypothetical protein